MSDFHYIDAPRSLGRAGRIVVWIVVLALLGGVSAAVLILGDGYVRDAATGAVRGAVSDALGLSADQDLDIDVGGGLLLAQAITGSVDEVTATVPEFAFEGGSGSLELRVSGIPIPPTRAVDSVRARVSFDEAQLLAMQASISAAPLAELQLIEGVVNVTSSVDIGGAILPFVVALVPSVVDGSVVFTPGNVRLGDTTDSAENFAAGPYGPVLGPLLTPRTLCVAALLPSALALDSVEVLDGDALVITAVGNEVRLAGGGFTSRGSCG